MNLARQWHDDSTAAVSNVEPNTVAPDSKDKTNHPSSLKTAKLLKISLLTQLNLAGTATARRLKPSRATAVRQGKACRA